MHLQRQTGAGGGANRQQQQREQERGPSEAAQRVALREFAVRARSDSGETGAGAVLGLVDIGANLQGRYSNGKSTDNLPLLLCMG